MKQLTIIGNVGFDVVIKEINGNKFLEFSVAVNERFKKQDGTTVESTDWVNCSYRSIALAQYIRKGDKIMVQGNMKVNVYKAKDGSQRAGIHLNVFNVQLLANKREENTGTGNGSNSLPSYQGPPPPAEMQTDAPPATDDLPF
jgi:single-strand DNA-binding protein